jgi:DNA modification methylase
VIDIKLFHGDCLKLMENIPDNTIDLVLSDPPYGQNCRLLWDNVIDFELMWSHLIRITKDKSPIVLMGNQPFTTILNYSNLEMFRYEWVWDKHIPRGMHQAKSQPMRKHENISVFSKKYPHNYYPIMELRNKPVRVKNYNKNSKGTDGNYLDNSKWYEYTHKNPDTIITGCWEKNTGKVHATQKPVSLMEYLIKSYSLEGDTVLDFCFGSNTTGVASFNTNRNYIGIELTKEYFDIGKDRLKSLGASFD